MSTPGRRRGPGGRKLPSRKPNPLRGARPARESAGSFQAGSGAPKARRKPHGPSYDTRRRCICCGYIVNNSDRFGWRHKQQTFLVEFQGRASIVYTEVEDPEYVPMMKKALDVAAEQLGYRLVAI